MKISTIFDYSIVDAVTDVLYPIHVSQYAAFVFLICCQEFLGL